MARESSRPSTGWIAAAIAALAVAAYAFVIRPWHLRWGATAEEATRPLPGDTILPDPAAEATHAITIDAPAADVWPWLVQIGQGRGGFYSYDRLENVFGLDIHSTDRVLPEFQEIEEGDLIRLGPEEAWPAAFLQVALVEHERALVLRSPAGAPEAFVWAFVLEPVDDGTTRLIVRARSGPPASPGSWLAARVLVEPAHFVMERRMLLGIKERAESGKRRVARPEP